jgi:glycosyltransferase involved in cell wall biosynthesis
MASEGRPEPARLQLRVVVGVHDGVLSGVNTYAEQVAAAGAAAGAEVTLLATHASLARELAERLAGTSVTVMDLGMAPATPGQRRMERIFPAYAAGRLASAIRVGAGGLGHFDVAHANHPPLASALRPLADRVVVAAWFHPHAPVGRAIETWRHTGRRFPRSLGLAAKGVLHYRNDARGYREADVALAPTRLLADALSRAGIAAVHCPPPCRVEEEEVDPPANPTSRPRLLVCSGDLSHPRKNVGLAVEAVGRLSRRLPGRISLDLVGRNAERLAPQLRRLPPEVEVRAWGALIPADVHALMRDADALLVPSRFEEWGYVAVEAALRGTPVVSLAVYPFEEMLAGGLGACAAAPTPEGYADAIALVLAEARDRASVASVAAERFGEASVGHRLTRVWGFERPPVPR